MVLISLYKSSVSSREHVHLYVETDTASHVRESIISKVLKARAALSMFLSFLCVSGERSTEIDVIL